MRRRNTGSGTIWKRGRLWWIAWSADGKRHKVSAGTTAKHEAEALLHRKLAERVAGKRAAIGLPLTVKELTGMVLADYIANQKKSIARARLSSHHLCRVLGATTHAATVDEATATAYIARRQGEGAATASINRELACLKRGFRLAVKSRRLERRPDITLLTERNARAGFLEDHHYHAVLAHLNVDERPVIEVAYHTGWRVPSEILTRERRHLDLKAGWLRLDPEETKNRKGRMFPLTPELRQVLEEQVARIEAAEREKGRMIPWLFPRLDPFHFGDRINRLHSWHEACRKAGCPGRLMHDFRRTAVRNMERAGVSRSAGMALSGHLTTAVYQRYAVVDETTLREAAEKIAALRKGRR